MCGIAGYYAPQDAGYKGVIERMTSRLAHRGPDSAGLWFDEEASGFALGHRRLSIIDLSEAGHQPMISDSGRYAIVFNGEIYNFRELAKELEERGARFKGHSDTEVFLAAVEAWGFESALQKAGGMFAIALWDRREKTLFLARDRIGKKPLYFGNHKGRFFFASELKALHEIGEFRPEINRAALAEFLRHNYAPSPLSIYEGIYKLPPGHYAALPADTLCGAARQEFFARIKPFWSAASEARRGLDNPFAGDERAALNALEERIETAVKERMIADVPLGAFLSGGIDSSLVAAMMAKISDKPPKTFSIGYEEMGFNEAPHAKAIAAHIGADHTELILRPDDALGVLQELPEIYDEPFSDSSQIPTLHVSSLARSKVTVALSGDGGDELFFGYARYMETLGLHRKLARLPGPVKSTLAAMCRAAPQDALESVLKKAGLSQKIRADRLSKIAELLSLETDAQFQEWMLSQWKNPHALVIGARETERSFPAYDLSGFEGDMASILMLHDQLNYLPEDNLVKVDRASMSCALEVRSPLLDYRLIEFAWSLPFSMKYRDGTSKYLLKKLLARHIPQELFERPKQGFSVPVGEWIRGPLRGWVEELLDEKRLREEGFFHPGPIRKKWEEHLSGARDWHPRLWSVLMFQAWLERWGRK